MQWYCEICRAYKATFIHRRIALSNLNWINDFEMLSSIVWYERVQATICGGFEAVSRDWNKSSKQLSFPKRRIKQDDKVFPSFWHSKKAKVALDPSNKWRQSISHRNWLLVQCSAYKRAKAESVRERVRRSGTYCSKAYQNQATCSTIRKQAKQLRSDS